VSSQRTWNKIDNNPFGSLSQQTAPRLVRQPYESGLVCVI